MSPKTSSILPPILEDIPVREELIPENTSTLLIIFSHWSPFFSTAAFTLETHSLSFEHFCSSHPMKEYIDFAKLLTFFKTPLTDPNPPINQFNPPIIPLKPFSRKLNNFAKIPDTNCSAAHKGPFISLPSKF